MKNKDLSAKVTSSDIHSLAYKLKSTFEDSWGEIRLQPNEFKSISDELSEKIRTYKYSKKNGFSLKDIDALDEMERYICDFKYYVSDYLEFYDQLKKIERTSGITGSKYNYFRAKMSLSDSCSGSQGEWTFSSMINRFETQNKYIIDRYKMHKSLLSQCLDSLMHKY